MREDEAVTPDESSFNSPNPPGSNDTAHSLTHSELLRAAHRIGRRLDAQHEDLEDDAAALRWRRALLRLSETFLDAAEERRDLSPILLGALHNALEQLLIHGEETDLMALEEWLSHEPPSSAGSTSGEIADVPLAVETDYSGLERRLNEERRTLSDRRNGDRRHIARRS